MDWPTLFSVLATDPPRKCSATSATTAMRARSSAYSTRLAPTSSLRFHVERIGSITAITSETMFTVSLPSWRLGRKTMCAPVDSTVRLVDRAAHVVERVGDGPAQEVQCHEGDHGDEGEEERVLDQTGAHLVPAVPGGADRVDRAQHESKDVH